MRSDKILYSWSENDENATYVRKREIKSDTKNKEIKAKRTIFINAHLAQIKWRFRAVSRQIRHIFRVNYKLFV